MPRAPRLVIPGVAHHLTQRGNGGQPVFLNDGHRQVFLRILEENCGRYGVSILGYCLMPDHYHVLAVPQSVDGHCRAFCRIHADFARLVNFERRTSGHLWQGRYWLTALDAAHTWRAAAYLERNPVRAGLCRLAEFHKWSSASARLGLRPAPDWLDLSAWRAAWSPGQWREWLRNATGDSVFRPELLRATRTGTPMGEELRLRAAAEFGWKPRQYGPGRPKRRSAAA